MITRVQAKNFKSFKEIDVELGPMTVFVGRNASGKSNFVDLLRFVRDALTKGLDSAVSERGGFSAISGDQLSTLEISLHLNNGFARGTYSFSLAEKFDGGVQITHEAVETNRAEDKRQISATLKNGRLYDTSMPTVGDGVGLGLQSDNNLLALHLISNQDPYWWLYQQITSVNCYHVFPDAFREPQMAVTPPKMNDYGHGMYSVLRRLLAEPQSKATILNAMSYIVEDISDITVGELGIYLIAQIKHQTTYEDGTITVPEKQFAFKQESDGTLHVLGLLVGLYQDMTDGRILAFEEPELAVHPGALALLYELFDEASLTRQIIITTQSPDLIAHFGADQLRVVERIDGESKIGRLEPSQIEAMNTEIFSGGDLLRIEGLHRREVVENVQPEKEPVGHA